MKQRLFAPRIQIRPKSKEIKSTNLKIFAKLILIKLFLFLTKLKTPSVVSIRKVFNK